MKNQNKFTPGPWSVEGAQKSSGVYANKTMIAACQTTALTGQQHAANARLIAAAPELLEALKLMLDVYKGDIKSPVKTSAQTKAYYAVAKATGNAE